MKDIFLAVLKTGGGFSFSLLLGVIAIKIIAVMIGPAGVGLFSLLYQTQQTASLVGSLGNGTALVQGLARQDADNKSTYLSQVSVYFFIFSLITCLIYLALSPWLGAWLLGENYVNANYLVAGLVFPSFLGMLLIYCKSVLNGYRLIGKVVILQIIAMAGLALFAYPFSLLAHTKSDWAMLFLITVGMLIAVPIGFLYLKMNHLLPALKSLFRFVYNPSIAKSFLSMSFITIATSFFSMGTVLVLRAFVVHSHGLNAAGIFDAAWTLSMTYMLLILTSFGTYYMPTLTSINDKRKRTVFIKQILHVAVLFSVPLITTVILFKPLIISLFYSNEFVESIKIMQWMLIGDYLKITSWVLAFPMIAYAHMRAYFWSELLCNITLIIFSYVALFVYHNLETVGLIYLLNYAIYFSYVLYYAYKKHALKLNMKMILSWLLGLGVILLASLSVWNDQRIGFLNSIMCLSLALGFSIFFLKKKEKFAIYKYLQLTKPSVEGR